MHTPVLLEEAVEALQITPRGRYIDATAGEGGHLRKMLELGGKVLALDWDSNQIKNLELRIKSENITFAVGNFANIADIAKKNNFYPVDGVLFDLGLSMYQLSSGERGFSFKNLDEPLDMRVSTRTQSRASDVINILGEQELYDLLSKTSEEPLSGPIAQAIVRERVQHRINTVGDLLNAIDTALRQKNIINDFEKVKIYTRIFQGLRIIVNSEFDNLKKGLKQSLDVTRECGRIAIITFHSLEDRIVKQFIRQNNLKTVSKKVVAGDRTKKFERSAKLRVIEK